MTPLERISRAFELGDTFALHEARGLLVRTHREPQFVSLTERSVRVLNSAPLPTGYVPEMTYSDHYDFMTRMHKQIEICADYIIDTRPARCADCGKCEAGLDRESARQGIPRGG